MFVFVQHHPETIRRVQALDRQGVSLREIERVTGVSRGTVARWRARNFEQASLSAASWEVGPSYAYVLGLYLGDGCVCLPGRCRTHNIDIACDAQYGSILAEATRALSDVFPHAPIRRSRQRNSGCVNLRVRHPAVLSAFPQHGVGRKHEREIELTDWQRRLTHRFPHLFIRGLMHSDGSRCINRFDTMLPSGRLAHYEYVRYFFTNYSEDIRRIFCEHCELLGIRWTHSNPRNISISHRDSVAILEGIVGPKA